MYLSTAGAGKNTKKIEIVAERKASIGSKTQTLGIRLCIEYSYVITF